jgi:peptidoglycan hydrolase-like protein with peptidoglycan-binding domain
MIFAARCLGLGILLGISVGGVSPLYAQSSSTAISPAGSPTAAPVRSSLTLGSQGPEVTELQSILQLLGFYLGRIDGVFSEATQQSVQRFQQAAGLPTTGQMTLIDWNRLLPSATGQASQPVPLAAAVSPQPTPVPSASAPVPPPNPTAQSFPIPEAAILPPSGSSVTPPSSIAPPSLPPAESPNPPRPTAEPAANNSPRSNPSQENLTVPVLRLGSEGTEVERLQQRLGAWGFYSGEIDGIFGEATEESVRQFQEKFDLEIDGIVGQSTWETLFNTPQ